MSCGVDHLAKLAVFGAAYAFDLEYTYKYPDALLGILKPGMRVLAPFGRSNEKRICLVTQLLGDDSPKEGIKPILSLVDREPLLSEELLELVRWLKERTFCTFYEAYRTVVPAGYSVEKKSSYRLSNHRPDVELEPQEQLLYEALLQASGQREIDALLDCSSSPGKREVVDSLVEKGIIEEESSFKRRVSDETIRMVRLAEDYMQPEKKASSQKQRAVVEFLEENETASVKELCYYLTITTTIVTNMIKKGILKEYRYEALRVPKRELCEPLQKPVLTDEQSEVFKGLSLMADENKPSGALLHGVTGSGKTAVFISLISHVLDMGKTALMLVPEIALTPQTVRRFMSAFKEDIAVLHSGLSLGRRMDEFKRIRRGGVRIVIGTRSAVFAPLENIGVIILDEEGEQSYRSDRSPRYHAREVAKKRCAAHNALLLMASATPSLETYHLAVIGRYRLFELSHRYGGNRLPQVVVADMITEAESGNDGIFCLDMVRRIREEMEKGNKSILLLNRRGYNTTVTCLGCKSALKCPKCLLPLTYHKSNGKLMCHYCGYYESYTGLCPSCGSDKLRLVGLGTQRLEEELASSFPNARVLRMDADTTGSRYAYEEGFAAFEKGEYDIMIGTQMIAKGLDFPRVTTVGVISLDSSLFAGDYKSYERTFSLLTQVCGRGGRDSEEAVAYIQTFLPEHHIITLASRQDYRSFYEGEIALRRELIYPPFCDICRLVVSSELERDALAGANELISMMKERLSKLKPSFPLLVLGPAKQGLGRINGRYRYCLTLKCKNCRELRELISELLIEGSKKRSLAKLRIYADMNGI